MSGRAGRRGMDEIGYVVIVGTPFQTPEEVAELVLSDANPLESKFRQVTLWFSICSRDLHLKKRRSLF